jgi:hypothetical protein
MKNALGAARVPPFHLFPGLALVAVFWVASWTHFGFLGSYAFFPQWLGYILVVDACVAWRRGTSMLTRSPREFVALFVLSAPVWWLFEGLNNFVLNWHYVDTEDFQFWRMLLVGSIDFSTVIPAVFETTALLSTFQFIERMRIRRRFVISPRLPWALMYAGAFSLAAVVAVPTFAFPLAWIWLVLIADALNYLRARPSLLEQISRGDWRTVAALALAAALCGIFWEMWNYYAMPKWFYTVPFVGFLKVFEMPLLGYGGYWPFAWELYALYHLVWGVTKRRPEAFASEMEKLGIGTRMEQTR